MSLFSTAALAAAVAPLAVALTVVVTAALSASYELMSFMSNLSGHKLPTKIINKPQTVKARHMFMRYKMLPVLLLTNIVARLKGQKAVTYKMLNSPRPVQVLRKRKSRLMKWKSKNEKNIRNAKMLDYVRINELTSGKTIKTEP